MPLPSNASSSRRDLPAPGHPRGKWLTTVGLEHTIHRSERLPVEPVAAGEERSVKDSIANDRRNGHGLCAEQAPSVFSLDDNVKLTYRFEGSKVPAESVSAVGSCPVAALRGSP
jgi:ferredoxin